MNTSSRQQKNLGPIIIDPHNPRNLLVENHDQGALEAIELVMPLDLKKKFIKLIDRSKGPCHFERMPGQRSIDKATLSVYVTRTNLARLRKLAKREGKTLTDVVNRLIFEAVGDIELEPEDYEQISKEQKEWLAGRDKRNKRKRDS